jgi:hypothetical protein
VLASAGNLASPWMPFEIGAARVTEKPIFVIRVSSDPLPAYLATFPVRSPSQLPKLAEELRSLRASGSASTRAGRPALARRPQPA